MKELNSKELNELLHKFYFDPSTEEMSFKEYMEHSGYVLENGKWMK